jgi:SNF2 family DNA or RNA helicase
VIEAFQAGELQVLLVMIQTGGAGLSLHDLVGDKPRVALISPPWSAVQLRQTLGRIHRAGGKSRCVQRLLYAADTLEEKVCETVRRKLNNLSLLNDGDLDPLVVAMESKTEETQHE